MPRVIITGSRSWHCHNVATLVLSRLDKRYGYRNVTIIHGDCKGVDRTFAKVAAGYPGEGFALEAYPADWSRGKGAGPRRNQQMCDSGADFAIAVHRDPASSKGTLDCVKRCIRAGIPVYLIDTGDGDISQVLQLDGSEIVTGKRHRLVAQD